MATGKDEGFSKALRGASDLYTEINPGDTTLNEKVTDLGFVPDLVFLQVQNDNIQNRSTVEFLGPLMRQFKDKGSFVINWNGDIRATTPLWMLRFTEFVHNRSDRFLTDSPDPPSLCRFAYCET